MKKSYVFMLCKTLIILVAIVLSASGCANTTVLGKVALPENPNESSSIVFCRSARFYGMAMGITYELDGNPLFRIPGGKKTQFFVEPGEHKIIAYVPQPSGGINMPFVNFNAVAGEEVYIYSNIDILKLVEKNTLGECLSKSANVDIQ